MQKRSHLNQTIKHFRLQCAQAIIRNLGSNLEDEHAVELCDQYALRIFINWVATKYGFEACGRDMQSAKPEAMTTLENGFWDADVYPLQSILDHKRDLELRDHGFALLENTLPPRLDVVGEIYQQSIRSPLTIKYGHPVIRALTQRSTSAEFYTPPWVVSYCFQQIKSGLHPNKKIFDPSCGTGNYLLGAAAHAAATGADVSEFVSGALFGQDLDPRALALCRLSLFIFAAGDLWTKSGNRNRTLLKRMAVRLREHLLVADSTLGSVCDEYDVVATNPPYISFGSRGQSKMVPSQAQLLRTLYPESSEYKIRLHSLFQDLCIQAAQPSGEVLLLLPDAYLTGSYYKKLRGLLIEEADIVRITELPRDTISDATVGNWCIAHYRKKDSATKQVSVTVARVGKEGTLQSSVKVPFSVFVSSDCLRFNVVTSTQDAELIGHLRRFPLLRETLSGHTGIRSRHGQKAIIAESQLGEKYRRGFISGSQIRPFNHLWLGHWLNIAKELLFAGGFNPEIVEQPKLMLRQTGDAIVAAADHEAFYHLNNIHTFAPQAESVDLDAYAALLNSRLFSYIYRLRSRETGRALAQIDIDMVESMPLPRLNGSGALLSIAGQTLRRMGRQRLSADSGNADLQYQKLITSVDRIVYDLYELPDEIVQHIDRDYIPTGSQARELIMTLQTNCDAYYSIDE